MRAYQQKESTARVTSIIFFFNDTATTEIYTLSLHDALPIYRDAQEDPALQPERHRLGGREGRRDRKSTRLNSSHGYISYAVFCLKKKKTLNIFFDPFNEPYLHDHLDPLAINQDLTSSLDSRT